MARKKLRGAVIGYGFIAASGHIPAYRQRGQSLADVEIVAVADTSAERRDLARQALPQARIYHDYDALLDCEAARLDFIDVATPPCDHAAIVHAGLAHGCHVLCEKPMTCGVDEAHALLAHARRAERVLFPCHNYKHAPIIKKIGAIIASGRLGKVHGVRLTTYRDTHAKGATRENLHWRRDSRYSGGGIAMDHGSHSFYLTFDWMGGYPTSVRAIMSNVQPGQYDTEDDFSAVLDFPNGVAQVHLTWTAGVRKVIYTVSGDQGTLTMEDDRLRIDNVSPTLLPDAKPSPLGAELCIGSQWSDSSHADWFNGLFDDFCCAIERHDFAGNEAQQALCCIQLIQTAYRSARLGGLTLALD